MGPLIHSSIKKCATCAMKTTCTIIKTVDHLLEKSSAADLKKRKLGELWAHNLLTQAILKNFDHMTKMMTSRVPGDIREKIFLTKIFLNKFQGKS